ncbi:aarF domain-containing protein kinase 1 [Nematostella vectensis]|uniref:aarF domain-containing protein kinase 1 n=1 Tax=Nematostella vectensis TaxID=45351 RepID=UPI0020772B8C|nr:aarF domain-containing protein kinase 1 [Nematostella vectensis]
MMTTGRLWPVCFRGAVVASCCGVSLAFCREDEGQSFIKTNSRLNSSGLVRCGRAVWTVVKISFDYKTTLMGLDRNSEKYSRLMSEVHLRSAVKLRDLCAINGGVYIKGAQYISALDYLLPMEYVETMKVFHNEAPQSTIADIYRTLEEDLGVSPDEVFSRFDVVPIGCASLAQVHKAMLHDGRTVAIKVQHRDVQEHVTVDIYTIELLSKAVAWAFPEFKFTWLVDETKRNLPLELDFTHEGKNAEKVAKIFNSCTFLKVPEVLWKWTSRRVLVMEFCEGGKVDDIEFMQDHEIMSDEVSRKLGELYSEMIFVTGYVHCDPHPGNVLVRKDCNGSVEIVLLDHGLYNQLTDEFRVQYCKLWQSLIASDVEGIKKYSTELGVGDLYGLFACMLTARSWNIITSDGIDNGPVTDQEAEEIRSGVAEYLTHIADLLDRVPRQLLLILKTNDLLRSIDRQLHTSAAAQSFLTMSRCCIRAVTKQRLQDCDSWHCRLKARLDSVIGHLRVTCYQIYVSNVGRTFRYLLALIRVSGWS